MDVIRISTAGSVDDGKSTLIGRLLYDTGCITKDKLEAIEAASKRKGLDFTDLSLLTDGLIAEREQGITIDVAHIYFSTAGRKYIIADSPGHVEYTRNMITGASKAAVSLILADSRKGVVEQTRRHFYIASLLRIRQVLVCINKMDLVQYDPAAFYTIQQDVEIMAAKAGFAEQQVTFIPVVAKEGDNIVFPSRHMPWYTGETLLEYLEHINPSSGAGERPARYPIQYVIRPGQDTHHDFRGYAGKVESGSFAVGDEVTALPSLRTSVITSISTYRQKKTQALEKESVVITLEDELDISRGDMLVKKNQSIPQYAVIRATICWMDNRPMTAGKMYLLQHGTNRVKAKLTSIDSVLDVSTLDPFSEKKDIGLNDIGEVRLTLARPVFADSYLANPGNGSFILIDEHSHHTVAVGFIRE